MKFFPNLAKSLRTLFGALRLLIFVLAVLWVAGVGFASLMSGVAGPSKRGPILNSVGQVALELPMASIPLGANVDQPGSVGLGNLRGDLRLDTLSKDPAVVSTLRQTAFPAIIAMCIFGWVFFGCLRAVCSNLERGEVFTDNNFRAIRGVGAALIIYGLAEVLLKLWASHVINDFIHEHVSNAGLGLGTVHLTFSGIVYVGATTTIISGAFVLLMSEAFRQGLAIKAENDLTV